MMQPSTIPPRLSTRNSTRPSMLSQWWNKGIAYRIVLLAAIPLMTICVCCSIGIVLLASPAGQQAIRETEATETAQALSASHATATAASNATPRPSPTRAPNPTEGITPTPLATASPLPQVMATSVPSPGGPPYVGGPYANFVAAYGPPFGHGSGDSDNFYGDAAQTIVINVSPTSGTITHLGLVAPESWSNAETHDYLAQFLPSDAVLYNSVAQYTDYHSSVGDLVIGVFGQGTGVVSLVQ